MESHDPHHSRDACRVDSLLLSYHGPPVESLLGHSVRPTLWYLDILMLLLLRDAFWYVDSFRLWIWMTRITRLMMDNLRLSDFSIYHTFDAILGHISLSIKIYRFSWSHVILITYKMHVKLMAYCYLIMIPQWSLSWAIQSGSHFSTFRCHHASFFRRRLFNLWIWFCYGHRWLGLHTWW